MYKLPLFPLETVLFPGTPIFLHIFESRYKLMIKHCLETGQPFGVVLIRHGVEAMGPLPEPYFTGCTARIVSMEKLEDGRMNLVAMGDERFRILSLDLSKPYLTGQVESIPLENSTTIRVVRFRKLLNALVYKYVDLLKMIGAEEYELTDLQLPEDHLSVLYFSAALLQIPAFEKQPLLDAQSAQDLLSLVFRIYRREIAILSSLHQINDSEATRIAWLN
ncbi:MAG: LON peptidase substrate-binding domain-containing protein [Anaerolineae bacterium]|nr:LON peptidase substrate-binding domain-containing protein [Anaerolineae bacterium]